MVEWRDYRKWMAHKNKIWDALLWAQGYLRDIAEGSEERKQKNEEINQQTLWY